jgi:aminomethyltransferase
MVPFSGWHMPVQYEGITAEHQAVRTRAGLFDVSHMGELLLTGEGAAAFVNRLVTNDLSRIEPGRAMYTCCCNESGGILDDLIVYKRSDTDVLVVCNAGNRDKISSYFEERAAGECSFSDASDEIALLALQGPRALEILVAAGSSISDPAKSLGSFRFREGSVGAVRTTIARTGYTGEDGVELFCSSADAPALWRALVEAGKSFGLAPAGLGARDTLRLEARLSLYGNDIDETTNPIEAGLGWTVKLDGPDFIGKEALARIQAEGLKRRLVGFEMTERGIARHGYELLDERDKTIGVCTSGSPSPTLGKNIGLGYLPTQMAEVGTQFRVDCRGKRVGAVVVHTPFYKRRKP